jgi:hypothetical protein
MLSVPASTAPFLHHYHSSSTIKDTGLGCSIIDIVYRLPLHSVVLADMGLHVLFQVHCTRHPSRRRNAARVGGFMKSTTAG